MYRRPVVSPRWDITEADWIDHGPNPRFAIYNSGTPGTGDDAVYDKETGLVWERSPATDKKDWNAAIVYACSKALGGRMGWRLPAIEELLSLVDPSRNNPRLPAGHPFVNVKIDGEFYWSSTLGMTSPPTYAWGYDFSVGNVSNCLKSKPTYAWLVRGGYGHDYPF